MPAQTIRVAPLVGAWIEIKCAIPVIIMFFLVAPLVGAWIEIIYPDQSLSLQNVAPLVGAWIEISL